MRKLMLLVAALPMLAAMPPYTGAYKGSTPVTAIYRGGELCWMGAPALPDGIFFWLDPSVASTISTVDGFSIAAITDKAGSVAMTPNNTNFPTLFTYNGKTVLNWRYYMPIDGEASGHLEGMKDNTQEIRTGYIVVAAPSWPSQADRPNPENQFGDILTPWDGWGSMVDSPVRALSGSEIWGTPNQMNYTFADYGSGWSRIDGQPIGDGWRDVTTAHILSFSPIAGITLPGFTIGMTDWLGRRYHGYLCEVIFYSRELSIAENTAVHKYLSAKWGSPFTEFVENPTYTITFDSQGGSEVSPQSISGITAGTYYDQIQGLPADPVRDGFTFGGWFSYNWYDNVLPDSWFYYFVSGDETLYAQWY